MIMRSSPVRLYKGGQRQYMFQSCSAGYGHLASKSVSHADNSHSVSRLYCLVPIWDCNIIAVIGSGWIDLEFASEINDGTTETS